MTKQNCTSINPSTQSKKRSTKQLTTAEFIKRARLIHADYNYDYSGVVYTNNRAKVFMICPEHGFFAQTPKEHLRGKGCRGCGIEKARASSSSNLAEFVEKARAIHTCGNYSYEKSIYKSAAKKINITCKIHGEFNQVVSDHLGGHGCSSCAHGWSSTGKPLVKARKKTKPKKKKLTLTKKVNVYTTAYFIERATDLHKGLYTYEDAVYVDTCKTKLVITCKEHGRFSQTPNSHLRGRGCPECGKLTGGYSRSNFRKSCNRNHDGCGYLYVIKCSKGGEVFYKVGRTSETVSLRYSGKRMPYSYQVVYNILNHSDFIFDIERKLHNMLRDYSYEPNVFFEGRTECFTTIKPVERLLKRLSDTEQLQLIA